jgi:SAM-dependent methyltransferase
MSAIDEDQFFMSYRDSFDTVVAFSVFTHFDPTMALRYLKLLRNVTKPSGHLLLTWFLDHPSNPTGSRLPPGENFRDRDGQLRFAIFSPATVAEFATSAGLLIERVSYGTWRGGEWALTPLKGQHGQDIVILRRALPIEFDAKRYLEIHKDVADSGMDAVLHYLMYGCKERRTLSN